MRAPSNRKVLIVDDERRIRELLSSFFYAISYEVTTVSSGIEALGILMNGSYSLLILGDISDMDEIQLINEIRRECVCLSIIGVGIEDKESEFLRAGADYFLLKPFSIYHLKSIIHSLLKG